MSSRLERKKAVTIGDALMEFLKQARLSSGHNTRRIFEAWDQASGAEQYTVRRFFRDGKLYVTLSSSVVRYQLSFQKEALLEKINSILEADDLFIRDERNVTSVNELILK